MKVVLTEEDFKTLISGGIVEKENGAHLAERDGWDGKKSRIIVTNIY